MQILKAIQQKMFVPGDKLPGEMELVENFGVSRTAIREALNRLIGRGVVEYRKGSGVYVAAVEYSTVVDPFYHLLEMKCGDSSLQQIANVRLMIEPQIAKTAAVSRSQGDIDYWEECYFNMEKNIHDHRKMVGHDIQFHRRIGTSTGNHLIPVIMEPVYLLMNKFVSDTYTRPHSPELALKSHRDLLDCFKRKDANGAYGAMQQHMLEALEHAKNLLE